jgi:hypothetical protein
MAGTSLITASNIPAAAGTVVAISDSAAAAAQLPQRVEYPGNMVNMPATAFDTGARSWLLGLCTLVFECRDVG